MCKNKEGQKAPDHDPSWDLLSTLPTRLISALSKVPFLYQQSLFCLKTSPNALTHDRPAKMTDDNLIRVLPKIQNIHRLVGPRFNQEHQ